MPDPLETATPAPPAPVREGRKLTCVFCDCVMTADGQDIYHLGERAKKFQKHEETITKKDEEIARLNAKIAEQQQQIDALKGSGESRSASHRPGGRVTRTA